MRKATGLLMILASLFFYAFALGTPASADPDSPGNNGTVKIVNDQGDGQDDPDNDPQAAAIRKKTIVKVDQAGHWLHHDQLALFLRETKKFLAADERE
jgi:pimeloyl-ACP methyl ester carboxylesterase